MAARQDRPMTGVPAGTAGEDVARRVDADAAAGFPAPGDEQVARLAVQIGERLSVDSSPFGRTELRHAHEAVPKPGAVDLHGSIILARLLSPRATRHQLRGKRDSLTRQVGDYRVERLTQNGDDPVDLLPGQDERGRQYRKVADRTNDQPPRLRRARNLPADLEVAGERIPGVPILDELHAQHEVTAAHVADDRHAPERHTQLLRQTSLIAQGPEKVPVWAVAANAF